MKKTLHVEMGLIIRRGEKNENITVPQIPYTNEDVGNFVAVPVPQLFLDCYCYMTRLLMDRNTCNYGLP